MAGAYNKLFDIVCQHDYFDGQPCHPVQLQPTAACRRLLERYRMLWRPVAGGGALWYPSHGAPVPLASFNETAPLTFVLSSSDPELFNYTDVALPAPGLAPAGLYYFDNLERAAGGLLHPPGQPFHDGRLCLAAGRLDYPVETGANVTVRDRLSRQQVWPPPAARSPVGSGIDLAGLPEARYSLECDGATAFDFYLGHALPSSAWGVVAIYAGGTAQPARGFPIGVDGTPRPQSYHLILKPRSCVWRYYVVGKSAGQPAPTGSVVAIDHRAAGAARPPAGHFSALPEPVLVNGRRATVFVSGEELALSAVPDSSLSYCFRPASQGMEQGGDLALPYPGPGMLAAAAPDRSGWCADMYVYM